MRCPGKWHLNEMLLIYKIQSFLSLRVATSAGLCTAFYEEALNRQFVLSLTCVDVGQKLRLSLANTMKENVTGRLRKCTFCRTMCFITTAANPYLASKVWMCTELLRWNIHLNEKFFKCGYIKLLGTYPSLRYCTFTFTNSRRTDLELQFAAHTMYTV